MIFNESGCAKCCWVRKKRGLGRGLSPENGVDSKVSGQEAEDSCPDMHLEFLEIGG